VVNVKNNTRHVFQHGWQVISGENLHMKIAIVGLGYWGPNLVRNFLSTENVDNVICCDLVEQRLQRIRRQFGNVEVCSSYEEVLKRSDVDAVVLATPVSEHYPLGMKALQAGKHLLVEKPMTQTTEEAESLVDFAETNGLTLMVDHTFLYTSAVRKIKEYLTQGKIGEILYFDSVRVNLGLFQRDTNVIWDLAPHDISIMDYLVERKPTAVSAVGASHFNGREDIAYITINFPNNIIAHFHVNWISPVKVRRILIGGTKLMAVYDDMEPSEKIKLYDRGVQIKEQESIYKALVEYRIGDMFAPHVDQREALSMMTVDFVQAIRGGKHPVSDGHTGVNVVRILEAANLSLRSGGFVIRFSDEERGKNGSPLSRIQECPEAKNGNHHCPIEALFEEKPQA
jgi:predicted dehydrogenase